MNKLKSFIQELKKNRAIRKLVRREKAIYISLKYKTLKIEDPFVLKEWRKVKAEQKALEQSKKTYTNLSY